MSNSCPKEYRKFLWSYADRPEFFMKFCSVQLAVAWLAVACGTSMQFPVIVFAKKNDCLPMPMPMPGGCLAVRLPPDALLRLHAVHTAVAGPASPRGARGRGAGVAGPSLLRGAPHCPPPYRSTCSPAWHLPPCLPACPAWPSHAGPPMLELPCWHSHAGTPMLALPCWPSHAGSHADTPMLALPCWHSHAGTPMLTLPC